MEIKHQTKNWMKKSGYSNTNRSIGRRYRVKWFTIAWKLGFTIHDTRISGPYGANSNEKLIFYAWQ